MGQTPLATAHVRKIVGDNVEMQIESDSKKPVRELMNLLMPCDCMAQTPYTAPLSFSERLNGSSVMSECSLQECSRTYRLSMSR
jgi:hypothetical protein